MIAPDVEIVDLEPEGFAWFSSLLSARQRRAPHTLWVLRDGDVVRGIVDSRGGWEFDAAGESCRDAGGYAARLWAARGVDRVVVVDAAGLQSFGGDLAAAVRPERLQHEAFLDNEATFWASRAVTTVPAPPTSPWPRVREGVRSLGDDLWAVLAVYDGERCRASLVGRFRDGVLVTLTSLDAVAVPRPGRGRAEDVVTVVEGRFGPVALALCCDRAALEEVMTAVDLVGALASLPGRPGCLFQRNLGALA